ncbi:hypothetical protein KIPB_005583 [Kipferlia bialata]|uniref:Uncharacterized protein n=1 Tax=Kipferlia bialata TaxID=797122 RepID=A0A9K3CXA9_9EUKA|nr:hypothetical protein KIPB_005583 [Kipferlia bialata]|eukprot:g5583.t1
MCIKQYCVLAQDSAGNLVELSRTYTPEGQVVYQYHNLSSVLHAPTLSIAVPPAGCVYRGERNRAHLVCICLTKGDTPTLVMFHRLGNRRYWGYQTFQEQNNIPTLHPRSSALSVFYDTQLHVSYVDVRGVVVMLTRTQEKPPIWTSEDLYSGREVPRTLSGFVFAAQPNMLFVDNGGLVHRLTKRSFFSWGHRVLSNTVSSRESGLLSCNGRVSVYKTSKALHIFMTTPQGLIVRLSMSGFGYRTVSVTELTDKAKAPLSLSPPHVFTPPYPLAPLCVGYVSVSGAICLLYQDTSDMDTWYFENISAQTGLSIPSCDAKMPALPSVGRHYIRASGRDGDSDNHTESETGPALSEMSTLDARQALSEAFPDCDSASVIVPSVRGSYVILSRTHGRGDASTGGTPSVPQTSVGGGSKPAAQVCMCVRNGEGRALLIEGMPSEGWRVVDVTNRASQG